MIDERKRSGGGGWPLWLIDGAFMVLVAVAGWLLFTLDNDAPFHRHPDEPGKASQVLEKDWNFHHPMLMVRGTERIVKILMETRGFPRHAQSVTEVGRGFVAACSALGIACLAVLARRRFGWLAALAVALVLTTSGSVFHISHWFKEDPVLVMGWCALALALELYAARPSAGRAVAVGAAAALAASGKYIGVLGLPVALALLAGVPARGGWRAALRHCLLVVVAAVPVFCLINLQILLNWEAFADGLSREIHYVQEGHHGVRSHDGLHAEYLRYLALAVEWWAWPLAALGVAAIWLQRRARVTRAGLLAHLFPLLLAALYLLLISLSPKIIHRYTYPIVFFLMFYAALGAGAGLPGLLARVLPRARPLAASGAGAVAVAALLALNIWHGDARGVALADKIAAYRLDTFATLHQWMRANLPAEAVIYQPGRYHLPDSDLHIFKDVPRPIPQRVLSKGDLFHSGSLETARAHGVTHVLVGSSRHTRYLGDDVDGTASALDLRARMASTYRQLRAEGRVVYQMHDGPESSLHPALTLYDIRRQPQ